MIRRIFRLTDVKFIDAVAEEMDLGGDAVIVRPTYMSICAADHRYFFGKRKKAILQKKLPMALIHEGVGEVVYDARGRLSRGTKVALVPNFADVSDHSGVKANYQSSSRFCSSNMDGYMQDLIPVRYENLVALPQGDEKLYVFAELLSVACNAALAFAHHAVTQVKRIGVWGDGSVGFAMALVLKQLYPDATLCVFGHNQKKLQRFSFADETYFADLCPAEVSVDHAFECVGGPHAGDAINQMIDHIRPQGCISLLGVTEDLVGIHTRMVLEKGLQLIGNSRSDCDDFRQAVRFIAEDEAVRQYLSVLISAEITVRTIADLYAAFEKDAMCEFKTLIHWKM